MVSAHLTHLFSLASSDCSGVISRVVEVGFSFSCVGEGSGGLESSSVVTGGGVGVVGVDAGFGDWIGWGMSSMSFDRWLNGDSEE